MRCLSAFAFVCFFLRFTRLFVYSDFSTIEPRIACFRALGSLTDALCAAAAFIEDRTEVFNQYSAIYSENWRLSPFGTPWIALNRYHYTCEVDDALRNIR